MHLEKIEHAVVERVLSIAPGIASAESIKISPISLPDGAQGQAYMGVIVIGAGKQIPGASVKVTGVPSFPGSVYEKTMAASYFVIVLNEEIHVYLENQNILNFLDR